MQSAALIPPDLKQVTDAKREPAVIIVKSLAGVALKGDSRSFITHRS